MCNIMCNFSYNEGMNPKYLYSNLFKHIYHAALSGLNHLVLWSSLTFLVYLKKNQGSFNDSDPFVKWETCSME